MVKTISILLALAMIGGGGTASGSDTSTLLKDIENAVPGTAGCSLKQAKAAGELLDMAQSGYVADADEITVWLDSKSDSEKLELAYAYSEVLDVAEDIIDGDASAKAAAETAGYTLGSDSYDYSTYTAAAKSLSPIFTALLPGNGKKYSYEASTAYSKTTIDKFDGIWIDSELGEMLIISGNSCRAVIPYLDSYGEKAYPIRVRDRSSVGYCPSLEVDWYGGGDYSGALTYYVSGIDSTHFWSNTQGQRFNKAALS